MKILILDDEESMTDTLFEYLRETNEVLIFNNPVEALDHYRDNPDFDAVITDYRMPMMFGDGFIKRILTENSNQPIIIISGFIGDQKKEFLEENGKIIQIIEKPFDLNEISLALKKIQ